MAPGKMNSSVNIHEYFTNGNSTTAYQKSKNNKNINKKISNKTWTLATINCRTAQANTALHNYITNFDLKNIDIVALQEIHRIGNDNAIIKSLQSDTLYKVYWSGHKTLHTEGVGFAIKRSPNIEILEPPTPSANNSRIISITLRIYGINIRIVNGYAPTEDKSRPMKLKFWNDMRKEVRKDRSEPISNRNWKKTQLIICGDFNATTSLGLSKTNFSHRSNLQPAFTASESGEILIEKIREWKLHMLSSYFNTKNFKHRTTRVNPNKKLGRQKPDYIIANDFLHPYVTNCRVYNEVVDSTMSDHRLLMATFKTPASRCDRKKHHNNKLPRKSNPINLLEIPQLTRDIEIQKRYAESIKFNIHENMTTSELSSEMIRALSEAAIKSIPQKSKSKSILPWDSDPILQFLYASKRTVDSLQLKEVNKKIKKRFKYLQNQYHKEEANKLSDLQQSRQVEKEYKKIKEIAENNPFKKIKTKGCDPSKLKCFFKKHFNEETSDEPPFELKNPPEYIKELQQVGNWEAIKQEEPDIDEIKINLRKMKNGKSADDVPSEFLKYAESNPEFLQILKQMITEIWRGGDFPTNWGKSRIEALYKNKGSIKDPKMYRGLSIGSNLGKLINMIMINRLNPWYNQQLSQSQNGFRKNRGTTDAILRNKLIQSLAKKLGISIYCLFIDLSAAFDKVIRKWMFMAIRARIPPGSTQTIISIMERFYDNTTAYLQIDPTEEIFETNVGVRQGGVESPPLFCLFLDHVMRVYEHRLKEQGIEPITFEFNIPTSASGGITARKENKPMGKSEETWNGYADDTTIYQKSAKDLQIAFDVISQVYQDYKLKLNIEKTESMIYNYKADFDDYPETIVKSGVKEVKNSKSFRFLGSHCHFEQDTTGDFEINCRIELAQQKYASLRKLFENYNIKLTTRVKYFNIYIRSRLCYACQTWALTKTQFEKLNTIQSEFLRRLIKGGKKRIDPENMNFDYVITRATILAKCQTETLESFIRNQQEKFSSHHIRAPNNSQVKRLIFNGNKSKKRGKPTPNAFTQTIEYLQRDRDEYCRDVWKERNKKMRRQAELGKQK